MKRFFTFGLLLFVLGTLRVSAQFSQGTCYVSTSLSSLNFNYSDKGGVRVGINIDGGYFIDDCLMIRGSYGYNHYGKKSDAFDMGVGIRYYLQQNGLSIGTGTEFSHQSPNINNLRIPIEVGYTFYLNHYIAIEPQLFYKASLNDFSGGSEVGLRIGLGFYF